MLCTAVHDVHVDMKSKLTQFSYIRTSMTELLYSFVRVCGYRHNVKLINGLSLIFIS